MSIFDNLSPIVGQEILDIYSRARDNALGILAAAASYDLAAHVHADWIGRGREARLDCFIYPGVCLELERGETHAAMTQAVVTANQYAETYGLTLTWDVQNDGEQGFRKHLACVKDVDGRLLKNVEITAYLRGAACLRVPVGEPHTETIQDYDYVCTDSPAYDAVLATLTPA